MSKISCLRTIRQPYTFLLNSRNGYISISRSGKLFSVNLVTTEYYNQNKELYQEIEYKEFERQWDEFSAKAFDIFNSVDCNTFLAGSRIADRVKAAREII
jgi:hypothetical protein